MEAPDVSALNPEKFERLCEIAEAAARRYVISKVPQREISDLNITVEAGRKKGLTIDIDVEIRLSSSLKDVNAERLAQEAVEAAFKSVEEFLR